MKWGKGADVCMVSFEELFSARVSAEEGEVALSVGHGARSGVTG